MQKNILPSVLSIAALVITATSLMSSTQVSAYWNDSNYSWHQEQELPNIVTAMVETPRLSTLVAALKVADLVSTVQDGEFTVLAPSDKAFGKLPLGTVEDLVKPENKSTLTNILLYHVIPGKIDFDHVESGTTFKTVQGENVRFFENYGIKYIQTADGKFTTIKKSLYGSNGNAYIIGRVLLP